MADRAQALAVIDLETTSLPRGNDWTDVHILEAAMIVVDFDLREYARYSSVVKLNQASLQSLKDNQVVVQMHRENGLIADLKTASKTLREVEEEMIQVLKTKTTFDRGQFAIAGSGVLAFDLPLIKEKMPSLASWLVYYGYDIGVMRRMTRLFTRGADIVNPMPQSYKDGVKVHRALADAAAHLEEMNRYREWFAEKV